MANDSFLHEVDKLVSESLQRVTHLVGSEHEQLKAALRSKLQNIQGTLSKDVDVSEPSADITPAAFSQTAQSFSEPSAAKHSNLRRIVAALTSRPGRQGTGHGSQTSQLVQVLPASARGQDGDDAVDHSRSRMSVEAGIHFTERPEFSKDQEKDSSSSKLLSQMSHLTGADDQDDEEKNYIENKTGCRFRPVHPDSPVGTFWDVLAVLCMIHDFIALPLQVFYAAGEGSPSIAEICITVYWSLNLIVKFFIGFLDQNGQPVYSFTRVATRYAKTWLAFDVAFVTVDFVSFGVGGESFRVLLLLRLLRFLRLVRIFDFLKLIRSWIHLHVRSEGLNIVFGIIRITVVLLGVAHLFSCCWYYVGTLHTDVSWPKAYNVDQEIVSIRYFTSLHWSLVQYSGDSGIAPQNGSERIAACAIQSVAFILSAIIVSDLTTMMTQIQVISAHSNRQILILKRYLFDKKVSARLANRVVENAQQSLEERKRKPPEHTVELLAQISGPLLTELHYNMYMVHLRFNGFLARYDLANKASMRALCHAAVRMDRVSAEDVIFSVGEVMQNPSLYFVADEGCLHYRNRDERYIYAGTCVNEPVLWIGDWMQVGTLTAHKPSYLLSVLVLEAVKVMQQYRTKFFYPGRYAREFMKELKAADLYNLSDIASAFLDLEAIADNIFAGSGDARFAEPVGRTGRARNQLGKMLWTNQKSTSRAWGL
eukprot:TRINITY_DN12299_c0_g2_i1.p1 TRINITY_DN12299_c0_g2~~TRINITY_DN12299_c0_g2_i1.p1  ORF type:complete len:707 (+),score=101.78 TRINITY_DN12299_c0_g2_i1:145-2265(+)